MERERERGSDDLVVVVGRGRRRCRGAVGGDCGRGVSGVSERAAVVGARGETGEREGREKRERDGEGCGRERRDAVDAGDADADDVDAWNDADGDGRVAGDGYED